MTDAEAVSAPDTALRLPNYPITFFATVMGMLGLTLALHAAEQAFGLTAGVSRLALAVSVALFGAVAAGYTLKALRHPRAVVAEWNHPVRIAFVPTISISLLLLSVATLASWPGIAHPLWLVGTALQGALTLSVLANWIGHRPFQPQHLSPAWFIPAVGNVIVPVAGAPLGHVELSWLFFSTGLVFWLILLTLVMNRLIFHDPLPGKLQPTLVILIAPPAVAFLAYLRLEGQIDAFARILLNTGYVFFAIVATQARKLPGLPFALSWWALSFPMAALTIASFAFAGAAGSTAHLAIGTTLLAVLAAIMAVLVLRTVLAIRRHEICQPE